MALTYEESDALMKDDVFRGRIKVACLGYATYIQGEDPASQGHSARYRWMQNAVQNPDIVAMQVQPMVVMDSQVQNDGADITDQALQTTVETVVNKML